MVLGLYCLIRQVAAPCNRARARFALPVWLVARWSPINVFTLHQARLVPGWVTVLERINYFGTGPGTEVYSA